MRGVLLLLVGSGVAAGTSARAGTVTDALERLDSLSDSPTTAQGWVGAVSDRLVAAEVRPYARRAYLSEAMASFSTCRASFPAKHGPSPCDGVAAELEQALAREVARDTRRASEDEATSVADLAEDCAWLGQIRPSLQAAECEIDLAVALQDTVRLWGTVNALIEDERYTHLPATEHARTTLNGLQRLVELGEGPQARDAHETAIVHGIPLGALRWRGTASVYEQARLDLAQGKAPDELVWLAHRDARSWTSLTDDTLGLLEDQPGDPIITRYLVKSAVRAARSQPGLSRATRLALLQLARVQTDRCREHGRADCPRKEDVITRESLRLASGDRRVHVRR